MTDTPRKTRRDSFPEYGPIETTDDGKFTVTHNTSGRTIEADGVDRLENKATAHRIAQSLRGAFNVPEQRGQT